MPYKWRYFFVFPAILLFHHTVCSNHHPPYALSISWKMSFSPYLEATTSEISFRKKSHLLWCCMTKGSLNMNRALLLTQCVTPVVERQTINWTIEICLVTFFCNIQGVPLATEPGWLADSCSVSQQLGAIQTHTTDTFLFISHTTNLLLFKFRCNIFIGVRIIKEMPGSVASGTPCTSTSYVHYDPA